MGGGVLNQDGGGDANSDTSARAGVGRPATRHAFARDGGLLSYGPDQADPFRRAASYVDRILRGAKPGDLPVQFPTKLEMVVNLKTAKALGLAVSPSIPRPVLEVRRGAPGEAAGPR